MPKATKKASAKKATKKAATFTLPKMERDYQVKIFEDGVFPPPKATKTAPAKKGETPVGVAVMATICRKLAMQGPNTFTLRIGKNQLSKGVKNLGQVRIRFHQDGSHEPVALPRSWDPTRQDGPVTIVKKGKAKEDDVAVDAAAVKALEEAFSS